MKARKILLASLAFNAALAVAFFAVYWRSPAPAPPQSSVEYVTNFIAAPTPQEPTNEVSAQTIRFEWSMIATNDARQYLANLRRVECPERIVRELVVDQLGAQYRASFRRENRTYDPWVGRDRREADQRVERERAMGLRLEATSLVEELLGYPWNAEMSREWNRSPEASIFLGFLPDDKAQQTMSLVAGRIEMFESFMNDGRRVVIDEDYDQMKSMRGELDTRLAQLLTPMELEELQLRAQLPLCFGEMIHLDGMDLKGTELREFMRVTQKHFDILTTLLLERRNRADEAEQKLKFLALVDDVSEKLGRERGRELLLAQENDFREAYKFTKENNLPKATAAKLYDSRREAEQQLKELNSDKTLSAEERALALQVLKDATSASVATMLGPKYTNYVAGRGNWLARLGPPQSPPKAGGGK